MRLKYVKIINFRSIQEARVDFDPSCRTLVGINESGKTNILRALATIGGDYTPDAEDVREPLPKESPIKEAYVWFVFDLNKEDTDELYDAVRPKVLSKKEDAPLLVLNATANGKTVKLNQNLLRFCTT